MPRRRPSTGGCSTPACSRIEVDHRGARPRLGEVDALRRGSSSTVSPSRDARAAVDDEALGELHHVVVVGERLVRLEHRELGVVAGVDALVAEHATDLEHALEAADDEPLQVQLGRDAEVEIDVERVVMRDERARGRPAELVVSTGVSTSTKPAVGELAPDRRHRGEADREHASGVFVHDEVDVALPEAGVDVGEAVPLVGERAQRLGQQLEAVDLDRQLALAGWSSRCRRRRPSRRGRGRRTRRGPPRRARRGRRRAGSRPTGRAPWRR